MSKKKVSLAVGRGEKLSVEKGAGLTAKGRAKYNREITITHETKVVH